MCKWKLLDWSSWETFGTKDGMHSWMAGLFRFFERITFFEALSSNPAEVYWNSDTHLTALHGGCSLQGWHSAAY